MYIWLRQDWPQWRYDLAALTPVMLAVSQAQGRLFGRLADAGVGLRDQACLLAMTADVTGTSEIEGEILNPESVRSSLARRLGVDVGGAAPVDRQTDGVVDMLLDATVNAFEPLTRKRLHGWHAALFPTGYSGLSRIRVGQWRDDGKGPMQVVSGRIGGRQTVHFQAPPAVEIAAQMRLFLAWVNARTEHPIPALLKAGIGHLWFVTLHPFDDGNGRIARAVGDLLLTRADGSPQRFYSLSSQIQKERKAYYDILERTQKGGMDVTPWLSWFLDVLLCAVRQADSTLDRVLMKARFWQRWQQQALNTRQVKILNRLLDGFDARLTSRRWASMANCSADTALRDINELILLGTLRKAPGGGRSTSYELCDLYLPSR